MAADTTPRRCPRMGTEQEQALIKMREGKQYLPVAARILWFRDDHGTDLGIETVLLEGGQEAQYATVGARITNSDGRILATGMKTETRQDFPAGWTEKAETGAVGRALAFLGYGTNFELPPHDEEQRPCDSGAGKGHGGVPAPESPLWTGPGQCPNCHAPEGKRHGKPCITNGK